jgi:multiple antibiotic resistance protein
MTGSMIDLAVNLAKAIIILFIIVDPFGNIPIFMDLTKKMTDPQKRKIFNIACLVGFILLLVFALTGQEIFMIFGISIYSFEVAGGILLLIISIRILLTGNLSEKADSPESLGVVPIAMPLLVGPGAITTTIFSLQYYGVAIAALSVLIVLILTWVILRFMNSVYKVLGKTGSLVIARVMALLMAAIAIQYILNGLTTFLGTILH